MTDKIKLKADKFVNDKKLKLNYIKPKDLKILLAEFCEEQIAELKAECDLTIEGKDVKIKELEKENAELKEKLGNYQKGMFDEIEKRDKQLTKAKELLERLLITSCNSDVLNLLPNCSEVLRLRVEAEQFLSEVEK